MKKFKQFINEGFSVSRKTRAILPATEHFTDGKRKASIEDVGKHEREFWKDYIAKTPGKLHTTIQVAHVYPHSTWHDKSGENDIKPKLKFIYGAGHTSHKEDDYFNTHHDQTGAKLGLHKVVNTIHMTDGKIVHSHNDIGLDKKASLAVLK